MSGCSSSSGSKGAAGGRVAGSANAIGKTTVTDAQLRSEMSKKSSMLETEVRRLSKVRESMQQNGQNIDNINTELNNAINAARVATIGNTNENQTLRNIGNLNNDLSVYKWTPEKIQKTQNAAAKMILDKQNDDIKALMVV
jgi:chaperonin cofactor prefoldin